MSGEPKVSAGFIAVLSFVAVFLVIASAVWTNSRKSKQDGAKFAWEQREPTPKDQLRIILIVAAALLVCIILAALGLG